VGPRDPLAERTQNVTSKFMAISDLHLGQYGADGLGQYSLLSTRSPRNLVQQFAKSAATFADNNPFALLVAGDLLDLSLAYAEDAIVDLRELLCTLAHLRLDEIICVIGNHDHHIWSLHSEDKRLLAPLRSGCVPSNGSALGAKALYQTTPVEGEPLGLLQPLIDRVFGSTAPRVTIAYPSYVRMLSATTQLYVTHGHLFGGLYTELSDLLKIEIAGLPHDRALATVNHPLIEFVYWLLGETGEGLGADGLVEVIYTDMQKGTLSHASRLVTRLVAQLLPRRGLLGHWERKLVERAVIAELGKRLLSPPMAASASADRYAGLETTREGLRAWLEAIDWPKHQTTIALHGHTHVWDDYAIPGTGVHAWNLSSWLVEPNHPWPRTGFLGIDGEVARWIDVE
jgi:UDP-2,3-diacylglucosamine pyrophosphatase LpxH